jgi:hypothetical protein
MKVEVDCPRSPDLDESKTNAPWSVEVSLAVPDPNLEPKMTAWNRVYSVKERLRNEVSEYFDEWMMELVENNEPVPDVDALKRLIQGARDKARSSSLRRITPKQFIRAAFYDFMLMKAEPTFLLSFLYRLNGGFIS